MRSIWPCFVLLAWLFAGLDNGSVRADGGAVQLSERVGLYRITVFTAPVPLRAGPVDVSVLVQDAATGSPMSDVRVQVSAGPAGSEGAWLHFPATKEAATNKLFFAALFDLPASGRWQVEVNVEGPHGPAQTRFAVEAGPPPPRWAELGFWIGWPLVPILLFAVHQVLVRRRRTDGTR